jgi:hypothetical protein
MLDPSIWVLLKTKGFIDISVFNNDSAHVLSHDERDVYSGE